MDFIIMIFILSGLAMLSAAIQGQSVTQVVQLYIGG